MLSLVIVTISVFISSFCKANGFSDGQDTVYIYLTPSQTSVHEIGRSRYYKPHLSYPKDIRRIYLIHGFDNSKIDDSVRVNKNEMLLSTTPIVNGPDFFLERPKEFLKRDAMNKGGWKDRTFARATGIPCFLMYRSMMWSRKAGWYTKLFTMKYFLNGQTEVGDERAVQIFDRNRTYLGAGYGLRDNLRVQLGWMRQITTGWAKNQAQISLHHNW